MNGRSLGLLFVAVLAGACQKEAGPGLAACDRQGCSDACLELSGASCDVRLESCQTRIFEAVQCVHGAEGTLPQIRQLTEDEYRAEQLAEADDVQADAGSDAGADAGAATPSADTYDRALGLLGLYAMQSDADTADYLGGYYDSVSRSITLIDRGKAQDSSAAQVTMAHELVHALQDQQFGLSDYWRNGGRTTDAALARGCLTEGEATLYEELAWVLLQGLSVDVDYWERALAWRLKSAQDQVALSGTPVRQLWLLRYGTGARFLLDAWLAGGNDAVGALFNAPPTTTLAWMRGYDAHLTQGEPLTRPLACANAKPPDEFTLSHLDTLGAFGLYAFLSQNLSDGGPRPNARAWALAQGWRQDSFSVFEHPSGALAVSFRIRLADTALAQEVERHLAEFGVPAWRVERRGEELEIMATEGPANLFARWRGTSPSDCPVE